jgi:hypothetical protein
LETKIKKMTFKEIRELERTLETADLGPGAYIGNEINFGSKSKGIKINPEPNFMKRASQPLPGPG